MGKSWEIRRWEAAVSWPHVSLHCPGIHTYSHTWQFTRMNCVIRDFQIPMLNSLQDRSPVTRLYPQRTVADDYFQESECGGSNPSTCWWHRNRRCKRAGRMPPLAVNRQAIHQGSHGMSLRHESDALQALGEQSLAGGIHQFSHWCALILHHHGY